MVLEPETPQKCPKCGTKLLLNGPGWGFCDMCVSQITLVIDPVKPPVRNKVTSMRELFCECENWKKGFQQIKAAQFLAYNHGQTYTGRRFVYCPWCGEVLSFKELNIPDVENPENT